MSSSIWTRCAGHRELRRIRRRPWRVVESQHHVSTRKLVDSLDEQVLLERMLDWAKPPPSGPAELHYLLSTPFRYPPLKYGSRFGSREERGIWYGAVAPRTAFAESAYYRLVFLAGSQASLTPLEVPVTLFGADVDTRRAVDLTRPPFARYEAELASPTTYAACQALGREARAQGCEMLLFRSARDPSPGIDVAVLDPRAFADPRPIDSQSWSLRVEEHEVEARRLDAMASDGDRFQFSKEMFLVEGRLPSPAT